jgi:hypothetical protein
MHAQQHFLIDLNWAVTVIKINMHSGCKYFGWWCRIPDPAMANKQMTNGKYVGMNDML